MNENISRFFAALILFGGMGISFYFRRKADMTSGEKISRRVDGSAMMTTIRLGGLVLWLSPLVYLTNPGWMSWSKAGLPEWLRWLGLLIGLIGTGLIYWMFSSLGTGVTPTSATRREHKLVTHGPYRWVRHPLYTLGTSLFVSLGMIADNWFIVGLGVLAFVVMTIRTPREEANLIEKFGDEYREYTKRTGRFFPRVGGGS